MTRSTQVGPADTGSQPKVTRKRSTSSQPSSGRGGARRQGGRQATASKGTTQAQRQSGNPRQAGQQRQAGRPKRASQQRQASQQRSSAKSTASRQPQPGATQYLVAPDTSGPKVRVGVLWFFLALAAVTSGRLLTGILWAALSCVSGYQIVGAWQSARAGQGAGRAQSGKAQSGRAQSGRAQATSSKDVRSAESPPTDLKFRLVAAACAGVVPLLAAYGTGAAGLALILVPLIVVSVHMVSGDSPAKATATIIGAVLPALAAGSVVFAVRIDLWAGLFLVAAVSVYDAGSFLLGADAGSRWEGPVAGMIGALAVTFTMAAFHPSPFDGTTAWLAGIVITLTCALGQIVASICLPSPTARVRGLRRLDAYIVAGPAFLACAAAASL